jgi:Lipocalin-like domain
MKIKIFLFLIITSIFSCKKESKHPLEGTWKLITGTLIEKGDTVITDYTRGISFIKIINNSHFAFLQHDLKKGKDSTAVFVAGGGKYSINDSLYTEHLEYCSAREWEGNDFKFSYVINNDTLIQKGIEKIESQGVDRVNIEKYARIKK